MGSWTVPPNTPECEAWFLGAKPIVVGNADSINVGEVALGLGDDKLIQALGAGFLHTLEAHLQVDGEVDAQTLVRLNHVQPTEDGPLVVCGAASIQAVLGVLNELERVNAPAVLFQSL
ncbi:hypothetical protein BC936DRAFT_141684 [Jimgerdemannia flammicorona]|uniref:Uncharacterized protein n=1 Tax=Jimgerdemannia flammicorona TaxID=994334 RepID=A0A433DMI9_9FUNG|nr:hypothetical protein BC936DRAFT_141684 [Jimgerdemannia flammicorona]